MARDLRPLTKAVRNQEIKRQTAEDKEQLRRDLEEELKRGGKR